jgi:hypothetical protein
MTHLGDFGVEREPVDLTFGYFGTPIRVNPDLSDVAVIDMFGSLSEADENDGAAISKALRGVAETLVHSDDVEAFWQQVRTNRQTVEDLGELAAKIIEALTARPTQRPSDSSAGPSTTATRSTAGSPSQALGVLEGRPDLQVAVLRAAAS